jgi:hypothetical protein
MNERSQYKNRIELLQGTLDMLILQTLQWGPQHGYGISWTDGSGTLRIQDSSEAINESVTSVCPRNLARLLPPHP